MCLQGPRQRQDQGQDVDGLQPQVPAWLANSQKWLKSAGKKVAQAAKETTAQLQARLDEFEGRPARGALPCTHGRSRIHVPSFALGSLAASTSYTARDVVSMASGRDARFHA